MAAKRKINTGWFICIFFLLLYIFLPNNNQGYDSYSYAISVRDGTDLFHPHHLIYNLFGFVIYTIFSFTGLGSLKILSVVNTVFASLVLLFIYKIIKHRAGQLEAVIGAVMTGFVFSFWYYATSVEVNMPAIFFLILALYFLMVKSSHRLSPWLVYIFLCPGMLFHQIIALIGIPVLIFDIMRCKSIGSALKRAHPGIMAGALIYIIVAIEHAAEKNAVGIYKWITRYGHTGAWGRLDASNIKDAVWGKIKALYGGEIVREIFYTGEWNFSNVLILIGMVLIFASLAYLFLLSLVCVIKNKDNYGLLLLAMVVVSALFAFWWAPTDDGFWLYPIVIYMLFVFSSTFKARLNQIISVVVTIMLIALNTSCEFIPSSDKNKSHIYQGAMAFKRLALTGDDLVITSYSQARLAYEYYTGIYVPTTCMMFLPPGEKTTVLNDYHQRIENASSSGRVIFFEDEIKPDSYRSYLFDRFTIDEYEKMYKRYFDHLTPVDSIYVHGKNVRLFELNM